MSPEIISKLANLLPAGAMIVVIPPTAEGAATPTTGALTLSSGSVGTNAGPDANDADRPEVSVLTPLVQAGDHPELVSHWGRLLRGVVSARELTRAVERGALTASKRGSGRGHNANVVKPSDLLSYLKVRHGVESGEIIHQPAWWNDVRRKAA